MQYKLYINNEEQESDRTTSIFEIVHNVDIWVDIYSDLGYEITYQDDTEIELLRRKTEDVKVIRIVQE